MPYDHATTARKTETEAERLARQQRAEFASGAVTAQTRSSSPSQPADRTGAAGDTFKPMGAHLLAAVAKLEVR